MRHNLIATIFASALFAVLAGAAFGDEEITPLMKQELKSGEGLEGNVLRVDIDPGHQTERHTHPGDVFVYVLEGAIEIDAEGMDPVKASAGEMLYEPPDVPMIGRNLSSSEGARILIFQVGEIGEELTVAAPE